MTPVSLLACSGLGENQITLSNIEGRSQFMVVEEEGKRKAVRQRGRTPPGIYRTRAISHISKWLGVVFSISSLDCSHHVLENRARNSVPVSPL